MIEIYALDHRSLDKLVANHLGIALVDGCLFTKDPSDDQILYSPSTESALGDQIIDDEDLVVFKDANSEKWIATTKDNSISAHGETRLIAAMRCFVLNAYAKATLEKTSNRRPRP